MEAKAVARYVRVTPRKARQMVDVIRGRSYREALQLLQFMPKDAAGIVAKVVRSAGANAENNLELDPDNLVVAAAFVNQGPSLKRFMPKARGRADRIRKRTSHITIILKEKKEG
ncbi:MAG: 50S ribosomal protein L22 [Firmicutes bacterium]|nr:50S ribosomal protein L22 [Bacillota bacterium]